MNPPNDDFSLRFRHYSVPESEAVTDAVEETGELPLSDGPASLRPDPAALFRCGSVATVALASMFAVDAEAQTTSTTATTATTLEPVVVQGQQNSPYVARTISNPLYTEPLRDV